MEIKEFKQMLLDTIKWGWSGEYASQLSAQANNDKILKKIYKRVISWANTYCVCESDALISLIERGAFNCKKYAN